MTNVPVESQTMIWWISHSKEWMSVLQVGSLAISIIGGTKDARKALPKIRKLQTRSVWDDVDLPTFVPQPVSKEGMADANG